MKFYISHQKYKKGTQRNSFFTPRVQRKSEGSEIPFFQPKLTIGQPGDQYEQEADAMAEKVVSNQSPANVQQKCAACQEREGPVLTKLQRQEEGEEEMQAKFDIQRQAGEEEEEMQMKPEIQRMGGEEEEEMQAKFEVQRQEEEEEEVQAKPDGSMQAGSGFANRLNATKGGGNPMASNLQAQMSNSFGTDFSGVRIHTDHSAVQMNKDIKAQAFTHGKDIYFNQGKYQPESSDGKKLIAHELTHTIQQGAVKG